MDEGAKVTSPAAAASLPARPTWEFTKRKRPFGLGGEES